MNTKMIRWWVAVGVAFAVAAAATRAHAQEPRLAGRLPADALTQIEALLDSARTAGLPVEPLVDRALEGLSKRADPSRIVIAVRRLWGELRTARTALGRGAAPSELQAGASALRAGASAEDLAQLRTLRGGQLTVAAAVMADLVAVGVPTDNAVGAVLALAERAADTEYLAFRRSVERDIALGASPVAALGVRLDALAAEGVANTDRFSRPTTPQPRKP
jgi:hypothetical protein